MILFNFSSLKYLRDSQYILDNLILEHNVHDFTHLSYANHQRLALMVEIGELCQALETFKHWKKNKKLNYGLARKEYIDVLHFYLSYANCYNVDFTEYPKFRIQLKPYHYNEINFILMQLFTCVSIIDRFNDKISSTDEAFYYVLFYLEYLANYLEFTSLKEIMDAYDYKNEENILRIQNSY